MFKALEKHLPELGELKSLTLVIRSNATKDGFIVAMQAKLDDQDYGPINAKGTAEEFDGSINILFDKLFNKLKEAGKFEIDTTALDAQLSEEKPSRKPKAEAKTEVKKEVKTPEPKVDPEEAVVKEIKFKNTVDLTQDYDTVQTQYQNLIWAIEAAIKVHKKNKLLKDYYTEAQNTFAKWRMETEVPGPSVIKPNKAAVATAAEVAPAPEPLDPDDEEQQRLDDEEQQRLEEEEEEELPILNPLDKVVNIEVEQEEIHEEDPLQPIHEEEDIPFGGTPEEPEGDARLDIFNV